MPSERRDAGVREDQIEEQPAAARVGRRRRSPCRSSSSRRARGSAAFSASGDTWTPCFASASDTRHQFGIEEDAAGVEKDGFEHRHERNGIRSRRRQFAKPCLPCDLVPSAVSLIGQRDQRIDPRRAARGDRAGEERDDAERRRSPSASTSGSIGCTPNSCVSIARRIANAPARPTRDAEREQPQSFASRSGRRSAAPSLPSAMRMPISLRRCATWNASTP